MLLAIMNMQFIVHWYIVNMVTVKCQLQSPMNLVIKVRNNSLREFFIQINATESERKTNISDQN